MIPVFEFRSTFDRGDLIEAPNRPPMRRRAKIWLMHAIKRGGGFRAANMLNGQSIPILCYHGIWMVDDGYPGDAMFMRAQSFERRLEHILDLGLDVVTLEDVVSALKGERKLPSNSIAITIDDGWYGTYRYMLPALLHHGMPATLYCDTAQLMRGGVVPRVMARYVAKLIRQAGRELRAREALQRADDATKPHEWRMDAAEEFIRANNFEIEPYRQARAFEYMTADELRSFADAGFDVQLHTHNHTMRELDPEAVGEEIEANRATLGDILGRPTDAFRHFCYPSGVNNPAIADWLATTEVASATTTEMALAPLGSHPYLLPRIIDGDNLSEIEFEAEVSGFAPGLRRTLGRRTQGED